MGDRQSADTKKYYEAYEKMQFTSVVQGRGRVCEVSLRKVFVGLEGTVDVSHVDAHSATHQHVLRPLHDFAVHLLWDIAPAFALLCISGSLLCLDFRLASVFTD